MPDEDIDEAARELKEFIYRKAKELNIEVEYEELRRGGNYASDPNHPFIKVFKSIADQIYGLNLPIGVELGGNDGHYLASKNIPVVCFGPIRSDCNFHGKDEFIYIDDIGRVKEIIIELAKKKF